MVDISSEKYSLLGDCLKAEYNVMMILNFVLLIFFSLFCSLEAVWFF